MNRVLLPLLALLVLASIALPNTAHAYLITVNFTVQYSPTDPVYGASPPVNGSFQFDSSLIPPTLPGSVSNTSGLNITALNLTLAGHTYSTADADAVFLQFNAAGQLVNWLIGGDVAANAIQVGADDFGLSPFSLNYTYAGSPDLFDVAGVSWSVTYGTDEVPEPGSLALFAPALLALGLIRRRRG